MKDTLTIGTRQSPLAMWQTNWVAQRISQLAPHLKVNIQKMSTQGDRRLDLSLSAVGGKGLFTAELEEALLTGKIDLAVHSLKDLPTLMTNGLTLAAVSPREDPHDVLVSASGQKFNELVRGARIGTSSLRRVAQLRHSRPDLTFNEIRGNVETRLRKLDNGEFEGIILAAAGLQRLGLGERISEIMPFALCLPAAGQGVLAIQGRANDEISKFLRDNLNDMATEMAVQAERTFLETLQGGCQVPIGAYAEVKVEICTLRGLIVSLDGQELVRDQIEGDAHFAVELGRDLAERMLSQGGQAILAGVRNT